MRVAGRRLPQPLHVLRAQPLTVTRNAIWLLACRISGDFLNLLFFVIISRVFGPPGVGAYSYGFAVTGFVLVIGSLGIEEYGLREYARMKVADRSQFMAELLGTQLVTIVGALVGVGIYLSLTSPSNATLGIIASLAYYQAALSLSSSLFIPAMGQQHMMGRALIDLICRAVAFIFAGLAIYVWHTPVPKALLGYVLAATLLILLSIWSAAKHGGALRISVSWDALVKIATVLWSFAAVEVLAQLFARVGVIVLSLKVSEAAAGLYATGLRLIETGLMPLAFMGIAVYPHLSHLFREDKIAFQSVGLNFIWAMLVAGLILSWGLYFVAPSLLVPLLGSKYAGTEPVIMAMAALALMQALELGMGRVLFAADLQVPRAVAILLGATSALALNLLLVPKFAVDGAIAAGVLSFIIINIVYFLALRHPMRGTKFQQALLIPLAGLTLGIVVAWQCAAHRTLPWVQACASALVFVLVAGGGFWITRGRELLAARVRTDLMANREPRESL